ncbi:hypothetical protein SAMN05421858_2981 [Haladaptatus litoreus]|uniref:Uncharacterized protein n=1 Tax=Haladaptatus litoreus TaxID=553468 RepID=A0A1N7CGX3_9EURY|nr:hypothetical protein SAMN05421858_2981 [Haladaptatus litoreus]
MSLSEQQWYNDYFPNRKCKNFILSSFAVIGFWSYWAFTRGIVFATMYLVMFSFLGILFVLLLEW